MKGKDVTPTDLLNAARTMVTQSRPGTAGLWPRAAALLGRQALEAALDELWSRTHPGLERASMRCQLLCLPIVLRGPRMTRLTAGGLHGSRTRTARTSSSTGLTSNDPSAERYLRH